LEQSEFCSWQNSRRARAPGNVYSPGDGQTLCKVWLTSVKRRRCSNEANTRNPLKYAGVPQTGKPISVANAPKFAILWGHIEEISLFKNFFPIVDTCLSCEYSPTKLCDGAQMANFWYFLRPVFSASHVQHISNLHSKFALGPHHVWKYGRHLICDATAENRRRKNRRRNHRTKI